MEKIYCEKEQEHNATVQLAKEGLLRQEDVEKVCRVFRLIAEPTRMKILLALANGEMCVYHLTDVVEGTVSGVSHQLRILRENNVVKAKRFGKNVEYSLADGHIQEIIRMGVAHAACQKED